MAIYHCSVKIIGRGSGRSSVSASAYRSGEKMYNENDGITHDYTNRNSVASASYRSGDKLHSESDNLTHDFSEKRGVIYSEVMLPENANKELSDRGTLWNTIEKTEKRRDAQTAREVEISLPQKLTTEEHIKLTQEYVKENFVDKGMIADFSIHYSGHEHSQDDETEPIKPYNPHAHIMLTMRDVDENGFGKKNRDWNSKALLNEWRENWAKTANKHLEKHGSAERIDHRTLAEQGIIDREPMKYMGRGYKYIESHHLPEKKQPTQDIKISTAETRKIDNQLEWFRKHKKEFDEQLADINDLKEKRLKMQNTALIDERIEHLEKSMEFNIAEVERDFDKFDRPSVKDNMDMETSESTRDIFRNIIFER